MANYKFESDNLQDNPKAYKIRHLGHTVEGKKQNLAPGMKHRGWRRLGMSEHMIGESENETGDYFHSDG